MPSEHASRNAESFDYRLATGRLNQSEKVTICPPLQVLVLMERPSNVVVFVVRSADNMILYTTIHHRVSLLSHWKPQILSSSLDEDGRGTRFHLFYSIR